MDPPALVYSNASVTADINGAVTGALRLLGFSCRETGGTSGAATFRLIGSNNATTGPLRCSVTLRAKESSREWWSGGLSCMDGFSIDYIDGTFEIAVFYLPLA